MQGVRVGVMRQTIDAATADAGVMDIFEQALGSLKNAGALSDSRCTNYFTLQ